MKKLLMMVIMILTTALLAACGNSANQTTEDVIQSFQNAGLSIGEVSELKNKEFGNTRLEGKRILVPALGEDAGGRLFKFKDQEGLEKAKSYYVELGNGSPLFYSHTHSNGLFLLQMNGDMEDAEFAKYVYAMDEALK